MPHAPATDLRSRGFALLASTAALVFVLAGCKPSTPGADAPAIGSTASSSSAAVAPPSTPVASAAPDRAGSAVAASSDAGNRTGTGAAGAPLSAAEKRFIEKAAGGGLYEVEVGHLAATQGNKAAVKSFGEMLVSDHTQANNELKAIADARGVTWPTQMPAGKKREYDRLAALSGKAFDRKFMRTVGIKDHEADISLFEDASRSATDPELKAFIDKTLPALKQHLAQAQSLAGKGAASAGGKHAAQRT